MAEINLDDSAPLYEQVRRAVEAEIASGRLAPGDQVPSEPKLCKRFGVSQITVRHAMSELARAGLVIRRSGLGTFVAQKAATAPRREAGSLGFVYRPRLGGSLPADLARLAGELAWAAGGAQLALLPARSEEAGSSEFERLGAICRGGLVLAPGMMLPEPPAGAPPIVAIDPARTGSAPAEILLDRAEAGRISAEYLIRLGHRSIGFVGCAYRATGEAAGDVRAAAHLGGVVEAAELSGLALAPERCCEARDDEGLAALVEGAGRATGIVAFDDWAAVRVLAVARERRIRVPEELSIIGHGGTLGGAQISPELTTVAYDWKEIAAAAIGLVVSGSGTETFAGSVEVSQTTAKSLGGLG